MKPYGQIGKGHRNDDKPSRAREERAWRFSLDELVEQGRLPPGHCASDWWPCEECIGARREA